MKAEHWGYGLGCISGTELEQLYYEAERRAGSWKVGEAEAVGWLIAREQFHRLGMHGMAEEWSGSMNWPGDGKATYPVVRRLLDAEFRQRAWLDLRKGMPECENLPAPDLTESAFWWQGRDVESEVRKLEGLDFIESATSIAFVGEPLTLKTYYALAIGVQAMVERNKRVKAVNTAELVAMLESAKTSAALLRSRSKLLTHDLVIFDRFADVPIGQAGALLLSELLGKLAGSISVIVTTRLAVSGWSAAFGNSPECADLLKPFAEKCRVVNTGAAIRREDFDPEGLTVSAAPTNPAADDVPF